MASTDLIKNDYIIEKVTNVIYFVVKKDIHNIMLRREYDDDLQHYPIHHVNSFFEKIDYDTAMLLYSDENKLMTMGDRPQSKPVSMTMKKLKNAARALKGDLK